MKILGVIGGLGPMATAYFLRLLTEMTDAATDQEHIEILLHSRPSIPDRTRFILGLSGDSPLPDFLSIGRRLISQGAQVVAIPCVTAHYFQSGLEEELGVPVLNAVEETARCLSDAGVSRAGLLATDGTVAAGLFTGALNERGIDLLLPGAESQRMVMSLIYDDIKAGRPARMELLNRVSAELERGGAQAVILGCTELSVIKRDNRLGPEYIDALDALARRAVLECARLRPEYERLL